MADDSLQASSPRRRVKSWHLVLLGVFMGPPFLLLVPHLLSRVLGSCPKPTDLGLSATTTIGGPNDWQGCSLGCSVDWDLSVSSSMPGHDFVPGVSSWVSGLGECRAGDVITFSFPYSHWHPEFWFDRVLHHVSGVSFNGFLVVSGMPGDSDWRRHARPRRLRIWLRGHVIHEVEVRDEPNTQELKLGSHFILPGDTVRVEITDVQCGDDPQAPVAITALQPLGGH